MATPPTRTRESRYKDTDYFATTVHGVEQFMFDLMNPPVEFATIVAMFTKHRVRQGEVGFLDLIAVKYYGAGNEHFWWAIAMVNGIIDPELDMEMGQVLLVPPRDLVTRFLARRGSGIRDV